MCKNNDSKKKKPDLTNLKKIRVKNILRVFELLPDERETTPSDIIRFVAQHYGIRVADLKGRSNRQSIALPRQVAMYLIREILDLSFPEIGKIFGKHHSTVMYAVDAITKKRQSNPDFDATLTSFREHFN